MDAPTMTSYEKRTAIDAAWRTYRADAARLSANRRLGWTDYLDADQRAWQRYLAAERTILATKAA